jgi:hypothetical protein
MKNIFVIPLLAILIFSLFGCSSSERSGVDFNKDSLADRVNVDYSKTGFDINSQSGREISESRSCADKNCFADSVKECTSASVELEMKTQILSGTFNATVIGKHPKTELCKVATGFEGTIREAKYICLFTVTYNSDLKPVMVSPSTDNSDECSSIEAIMTTFGIEQ